MPDLSRKQSRTGLIFPCKGEKNLRPALFLAHSRVDQPDWSVVQAWGLSGELIQVKKYSYTKYNTEQGNKMFFVMLLECRFQWEMYLALIYFSYKISDRKT